MTVREVLDRVDAIKPSAFDDGVKLGWLNELEGEIQVQIHGVAPDAITVYRLPEDEGAQPLAPAPFDRVYHLTVAAMIDFANGEYDKYQNSMAMANSAYEDYARWYIRSHTRPGGRYITGY